MGVPWKCHVSSIGPWHFHETSVESSMNVHQLPRQIFCRNYHETFMEVSWTLMESFMDFQLPWKSSTPMNFHETSIKIHELLWTSMSFHETFTEVSWNFHRRSWTFMEMSWELYDFFMDVHAKIMEGPSRFHGSCMEVAWTFIEVPLKYHETLMEIPWKKFHWISIGVSRMFRKSSIKVPWNFHDASMEPPWRVPWSSISFLVNILLELPWNFHGNFINLHESVQGFSTSMEVINFHELPWSFHEQPWSWTSSMNFHETFMEAPWTSSSMNVHELTCKRK